MKLTGGEALVKQLELEGASQIFGVPGVQLDWAVDALRRSDKIKFHTTRNEQSTSYMADGFSRVTGKPGVCMVVPGPGVLNAMAGLATAYACGSKVLCVAGQIDSRGVDKGFGLLHEIKNSHAVFDAATKWHAMARSPAEVPALIRRAHAEMHAGRPAPVAVEIPQDVLAATAEVDLIAPGDDSAGRTRPDEAAIRAAADLLQRAEFPVIYAGGGVLAARASKSLVRLAERLGAPVIMSEQGRGAISDRHPLAFTTLEGRALAPQADLMLVVGSRFVSNSAPEAVWSAPGQRYIYVNIDPNGAAWPRPEGLHLAADAGLAMEALADEIDGRQAKRRTLDTGKAAALRAWRQSQVDAIEPQAAYVRALRAALPDDGIFVNELTQVGYFARVAFPIYEPHTMITPGHQGTLGYGFPTGLGIAAGAPDKPVIAITGDGGFGWCLQELSTAKKYNLPLVTVVFADGHFGNVRALMNEQFGESYQTELGNPDFVALAKAFGVNAARESDPVRLEALLKELVAARAPALVEVPVGRMPSPWSVLRLKGRQMENAPKFR